MRLLLDKGLTKADVEKKYPRVLELPFDSGRKLMTTVHQTDTGYISVTKGDFDRIPVHFGEALRARATQVHDAFADKALRLIAVAVMEREPLPKNASLFAAGLGVQIAVKALFFVVLTPAAFFIGRFVPVSPGTLASYATGITMAFMVLSWASVLNMFNVRSSESVFKGGFVANPWLT